MIYHDTSWRSSKATPLSSANGLVSPFSAWAVGHEHLRSLSFFSYHPTPTQKVSHPSTSCYDFRGRIALSAGGFVQQRSAKGLYTNPLQARLDRYVFLHKFAPLCWAICRYRAQQRLTVHSAGTPSYLIRWRTPVRGCCLLTTLSGRKHGLVSKKQIVVDFYL